MEKENQTRREQRELVQERRLSPNLSNSSSEETRAVKTSKYFNPQLQNLDFAEQKEEGLSEDMQKVFIRMHKSTQNEMAQLKEQLLKTQVSMKEMSKAYEFKMERLTKAVKVQEETLMYLKQEVARQYAEMRGRMNERRVSETKTHDLLDRHNMIVGQFEARMNQMKKVLEEKEMDSMRLRSELEEAVRWVKNSRKL